MTGKMNYWIIADTHFGHHKIQDYCQRPEGFEETILENLRQVVKQEDVLIHLGDICIYRDEEWHSALCSACAGKMWLVRGNHDRKSLSWYLSHGWDMVADNLTMEVFGKRVAFSHKPISAHSDFDLNIHGHHHNTGHHPEDETTGKHRLIFIEHSYAPINLRRLVEG
jgi:calcineurin-like phosphoesterase family protein